MLRFGMMRLHRQGEIRYLERSLDECSNSGFAPSVAARSHRHTSVLAVRNGAHVKRVVVDSEDSFFWMSSLVHDCDVYFCSGYSSRFFKERKFIKPYEWQTDPELAFYKERAAWLIQNYGSAFHRVKSYVPIPPNMARRISVGRTAQRWRNLRHKVASRLSGPRDWHFEHLDFEVRYRELLAYRAAVQLYDIVLVDSLWGWPRHRVALHRHLSELSERYNIQSRLNWSSPYACDAGDQSGLRQDDFPMSVGHIGDYEAMLSQSRLGVFATGFHYGWRNIMTLALMMGLPVYTDRLIVEPWFNMKEFQLVETEQFGLQGIEHAMQKLSCENHSAVKARNQAVFDRYLAPEALARHVLASV
jgi:hypothetical protein